LAATAAGSSMRRSSTSPQSPDHSMLPAIDIDTSAPTRSTVVGAVAPDLDMDGRRELSPRRRVREWARSTSSRCYTDASSTNVALCQRRSATCSALAQLLLGADVCVTRWRQVPEHQPRDESRQAALSPHLPTYRIHCSKRWCSDFNRLLCIAE
jgi:hypothetical protein